MTKTEAIEKVKALNLKPGSYIVFGSGPMAALGIRDVNDIDLLVTPEVKKEFVSLGWEKVQKGPKDAPVTSGDYEAHDSWEFSSYSPTLQELLSRSIDVDGIAFASIDDVRKWKAASARPKDLKDIELIDSYLAKNTE